MGVILAGGGARRMGGQDKALIELGGEPLLAHVIARLSPQVGEIILSANGNPKAYASFGLPVVPDSIKDGGPLAGLLAGMDWARENRPEARWLASAAVDTPLFPSDLVDRLYAAIGEGQSAVATSGGQLHPTFGLFHVALAGDLRAHLESGARKARGWSSIADAAKADFAAEPHNPFANINTVEDLETLEARSLGPR